MDNDIIVDENILENETNEEIIQLSNEFIEPVNYTYEFNIILVIMILIMFILIKGRRRKSWI